MTDEQDYYALLGVPRDADEQALRQAYRTLARRYHPDVVGTGSLERMQELNVAYQTLSDPVRRREYDLRYPAATTVPSARSAGTPTRPAPTQSSPRATETSTAGRTRPGRPARTARLRTGSVDVSKGPLQRLAQLDASETAPIVAVAFGAGGVQLALGLIDGRISLWNAHEGRIAATLAFSERSVVGALQAIRLSPSGRYAAAWGFQLGLRVWSIGERRAIWSATTSAPAGLMDAVLRDEPPLLRLAVPDAPIAIADDDPFRWAHLGRSASAIYSRPLDSATASNWLNPSRCDDQATSLFREPRGATWQVRQRLLSADGSHLLTLASDESSGTLRHGLHLWDLEHRALLGTSEPHAARRVIEPAEALGFPLAATPDLHTLACATDGSSAVRVLDADGHVRQTCATGHIPDGSLLALSPDAGLVALARQSRLDLYATKDGTLVQRWQFADEISALAFSPNAGAPVLAVALRNGLAELWAL